MPTPLETVNRFYQATEQRRAEALRDLVAEHVAFVGPLMQARGAEEYLALNAGFLPFHVRTRMLAQFAAGPDVCSLYDMDLRTPSGEGVTLQVADWVRVEGGRIVRQELRYDPRAFARAFGFPGDMAPGAPAAPPAPAGAAPGGAAPAGARRAGVAP